MKALSNDLVSRIIDHYQNSNDSLRKTAIIFSVGKSSVWRWCQDIQYVKKKRKNKLENLKSWIKSYISVKPFIRLKDVIIKIYELFKISIGISSVSRFLKKHNISYKKMRKVTKRPTNSEEIKNEFKNKMRNYGLDNILSFDEVGFQIEMYPSKGWSPKGERCNYESKKSGRKNYTGSFLICSKGIVSWSLSCKAMNIEYMLEFLDSLKTSDVKNKIIVMDNLRVHHNLKVKEKIKGFDLEIEWIPPYSPELNPVEEMFSMLKRELRYKLIGTENELRVQLERMISKINKKGLLGYFNHAFN